MFRRLSALCSKRRKAVAFLALATASALVLQSVQAAPLNADGVVQEALLRNHDIKAARAQVNAALGRLKQAGLWPNPRLELNNNTDRPFANEGEYSYSAGVSQDFPISGRLGRAEDVARVDIARALVEVNEAERKLAGDVASAFYEVASIDQKLVLRDRLIRSMEVLATATKDRYRAGEVSELDVNAAALELLRLKQERTTLAGDRAAAIRTLAGLVGLGADDNLTLTADLPVRKVLLPTAQLIAQAIERRPDLRLLSLSVDRAQAERALAAASVWEDWTVSLAVQRDKAVIDGTPPQPVGDSLMLTLAIPLPLFNQNEGSKAVAEAEATVAREQHTALSQRIENEVAGLRERVERLLDAVDAYEKQGLPLSRKSSEVARDAYQKGQISILEVVQAERQESEIGNSYAEALAQYLKAMTQLDAAIVAWAELMTHPVEAVVATEGES